MTQALTGKIIVLGVDGLDPKLAKKFMDQGKMPNLKKFVQKGSAREDLVLLGAMPTVTPPMWTTLSTGAYPATHGITAFFNQHPEKLDTRIYALDSRMCQAEQVWNVFAEAGKKTLVWHWPGSSWPPTSDSPNLAVVDGTQPASINMGTALIDWETIGLAGEDIPELKFMAHDAPANNGAGCVITGLDELVEESAGGSAKFKSLLGGGSGESRSIILTNKDSEIETLGNINFNVVNSPIKMATGWASAPEDAKEFIILTCDGFLRRPALILKNDQGIYDTIAIFKSKKDTIPLIKVKNGTLAANMMDDVLHKDETKEANRHIRVLELAPDGSRVRYWMSVAFDITSDAVWSPKTLLTDIVNNVGVVPPVSVATGKNPEYAEKLLLGSWDHYCDWQANALIHLMDKYDIIFSHLHNVDLMGHQIWHFAKHRDCWANDEVFYQGLLEATYKQTDDYLGRFLPYLDQGWTMIITSDHGLICEENHPPLLGEGGVNATVMSELGFTTLKKDENGDSIREVDWTKTKAIASRGCHININLAGKYPYGIVDPKDKYALEEEIITALYNYKDPHTGRRTVAMALRNKDAAVLGLNGPECGDIIYFMEEGFNIIHMDSLSTQEGYFDTSVSPIFVAAGSGIKPGYTTTRAIRQVDVAPTIAALGGVRMPDQSEGSVVHQILLS